MIYDTFGNRKYLTKAERNRFILTAQRHSGEVETFCLTLAFTGARISEVLALRSTNIDIAAGVIVIESLKKRRKGIYRQVPVPDQLLNLLAFQQKRASDDSRVRLWTWSRTTAWKRVKEIMEEGNLPASLASPKVLRHSFAVVGITEANVPLNMMQKWLGHARIETTAIYANAVGAEERIIAERLWNTE